jgi:membrane protease YdiL (CAAX protease family)
MTLATRQRRLPDSLAATLLVLGVAAASAVRLLAGGSAAPASIPAALGFAAVMAALAWTAGVRPAPPRPVAVLWGLGGAAVLVGGALLRTRGLVATPLSPWLLGAWMPATVLVAAGEEAVLRGALFTELRRTSGDTSALVGTTIVFGLIHLPLYGLGALPLDLAAGLLLGALRLRTRGVAAPLVAHVAADMVAPWI